MSQGYLYTGEELSRQWEESRQGYTLWIQRIAMKPLRQGKTKNHSAANDVTGKSLIPWRIQRAPGSQWLSRSRPFSRCGTLQSRHHRPQA